MEESQNTMTFFKSFWVMYVRSKYLIQDLRSLSLRNVNIKLDSLLTYSKRRHINEPTFDIPLGRSPALYGQISLNKNDGRSMVVRSTVLVLY